MEIILGTRDVFISLGWDFVSSVKQNAVKAIRDI